MLHGRTAQGCVAVGLLVGLVYGLSPAQAQYGRLPALADAAATQPTQELPPLPGGSTDAAPTPAPEKKVDAPAPEKEKKDTPPPDIFAKMPQVQPPQRMGFFALPPTGPGYYTLCDRLNDNYRKGPPKYPYPRLFAFPHSFFDVDWRYLDNPKNEDHDYFDCLKRIRLCDDLLMFSTGGEIRYRYQYEGNSRALNAPPATGPIQRFAGRDNNYDIFRTRIFTDLCVQDWMRVYLEFIYANTPNYLFTPNAVDHTGADLLNAFVDLRVWQFDNKPVWFRVGRQELCYGSQRSVSPLDWVNTRRTFDGLKLFWANDKWSVDAFLVQPVIPDFKRFDSVDHNVIFTGLWTTYRPNKNQVLDMYFLYLDRAGEAAQVRGRNDVPGGTNPATFGVRYAGDKDNWLWEAEGFLQFGNYSNQVQCAQAVSLGGGYQWRDHSWLPMLWMYYDYASGDPTPGTGGVHRTFDQLFPFGHYYFGPIDVVGRRNIHDISSNLTFWPEPWLFVQGQVHNFLLDRRRDFLYNAAGVGIRRSPNGSAGNNVGTELDLLINFHLSNHSDILVNYSVLFAGDFLRRTATTPGGRNNLEYLYLQYSYRW